MKGLYKKLIRLMYILSFPVSALYLHNSRRVRVLITYKDCVLLQQTSVGSQKWSLAGGGVEEDETALQAALREAQEEVGITIAESSIVCIGEERVPVRGKWPVVDVVFYKVELKKQEIPTITRPLEIIAAQWFKRSEIPKNHSKMIDIAFRLAEG